MKVLQVLCGRAWGGGSVVVLAITRALIERGDDVWVVSFEEENNRKFRDAGARVISLPLWFQPINPFDAVALASLWRTCRRERFDLVATHTSKGGFIGRLAARLAGVPNIVHHAHGFSFNKVLSPRQERFYIFLEKTAARAGDLIISVNEQQRQMALNFGVDEPDRICTVHNGIDLTPFARADRALVRRALGFDDSITLLGTVGRLEPQKGFIYLLRALPLIAPFMPNVHLAIAGTGPLDAELKAEVSRLGLSRRVHFLGFRRDIPDLLAAFDLYVQPSLWEGLSISLIEALAAGRPIVATDIEGNREVVDADRTGVLIPPADPASLATAVLLLAGDRERMEALGRNALQEARRRFSEQRMVEQNLALYDRIAARPRRRKKSGAAIPRLNETSFQGNPSSPEAGKRVMS